MVIMDLDVGCGSCEEVSQFSGYACLYMMAKEK